MATYIDRLKQVAQSQVKNWDKSYSDSVFDSLNHGTAIIDSSDQAFRYLYSYSAMHQAKLKHAFAQIKNLRALQNSSIDIVDYGAGQALGSMAWLDFLNDNVSGYSVDHICLVDASAIALKHANTYLKMTAMDFDVTTVNKDINLLKSSDLVNTSDNVRVHLFSNILDIDDINLKALYTKVKRNLSDVNYFVCVGPKNIGMHRLHKFAQYFTDDFNVSDSANIDANSLRKTSYGSSWTAYGVVFKVVV